MRHDWYFLTCWRLVRGVVAVLAITALMGGMALAQTPPLSQLPGAAEPGRLGLEVAPPVTTPSLRARSTPPVMQPLPPVGADPVLFTLQQVVVNGARVLTQQDLEPLWRDAVGAPVTEARVGALVLRLNALYRERGYILSSAVLDPAASDPGRGLVVMTADERGLDDVVFASESPRLLRQKRLVSVRKQLLADRPLRHQTLERALLLLQDLPGVMLDSVINPTPENGFVLTLTLRQRAWETMAGFDNLNTHYAGPWQGNVTQRRNGLFGAFDSLALNVAQGTDSHEYTTVAMTFDTPIRADGTTLTVAARRALSEPGFTLRELELESANTGLDLTISHPLLRQRDENLRLSLGVGGLNSRGKSQGQTYTRDRLRTVTFAGASDLVDRWGGMQASRVILTQGIPGLGASSNGDEFLSRANGKVDFTKLYTSTSRVQNLNDHVQLYGLVTGQYAFAQLLASEEFAFGGAGLGRGYDVSEIAGDHGLAALAEIRFFPQLDAEQARRLGAPQFYLSYDYGSVWRIDSDTRTARLTAASAAMGARFSVGHLVFIDAALAKPLTRPISSASDDSADNVRALLNATVRF